MDTNDIEILKNITFFYYKIRVTYRNYSGLNGVEFLKSYDERVFKHCMKINCICLDRRNRIASGASELLIQELCERWNEDDSLSFRDNFKEVAKIVLTPRQHLQLSEWLIKIQTTEGKERDDSIEKSRFGKNSPIDEAMRSLSKKESFEMLAYGLPLYEKVQEKMSIPLKKRYRGIKNIPLKYVGFTDAQYKIISEFIFKNTFKPAYTEERVDYTIKDLLDNVESLHQLKPASYEHLYTTLKNIGVEKYLE